MSLGCYDYLRNARRHMANGDKHLAEGRPDYARGSYTKAIRNYRRWKETDALLSGDWDRFEKMVAWHKAHAIVPISIGPAK